MFRLGRSFTLVRIFGIPVKMNPTWFLLLFLIVWSLASEDGLFRRWLAGTSASETDYWILGIVGALGLFVSLVAHELCHSVVARRTGMTVRGITLFVFGGVSEMGDEPHTPGAEFFMAAVGPLSSVLIGSMAGVLWALCKYGLNAPDTLNVLLLYLWLVNYLLALFNSIPAFPLDGGRVVRSILWGISGNLRQATRIAAGLGSAFAVVMVVGGVLALFNGGGIGGVWLILLGFFLHQAAGASLQQVVMRQALGGEPVGRFMTADPVTVPPDLTLRRFVDDYVLPHHFTLFPVVDEYGRLIGTVRSLDPRKVNQADWESASVGSVMNTVTQDVTISPETDAADALARLRGEDGRRLIVVQDGRPIGIVSLRDLLDFLAVKIDLGGPIVMGKS
jgi:Zn-dependent protease/CBS domain-containing protein